MDVGQTEVCLASVGTVDSSVGCGGERLSLFVAK